MKKLTLNLDALAVESFDTAAAAEPRGTVDAHQVRPTAPESCDYYCASQNISGCCTADPTCPATCQNTCPATCQNTCQGPTCGDGCEKTGVLVCPY